MADIAGGGAGLHHGDAAHHGFIGDVDQPLGLQLDVAHRIHAAGVAMPAVQDHGDVDIDDVAVAQRLVVRDAVADDMIDRGAERVAIAAIAQAGGNAAMGDDVVIGQLVERGGGDARLHLRHQQVQHFGGQPAGPAHALEIRRARAGSRRNGPCARLRKVSVSGMTVMGLNIRPKSGVFSRPVIHRRTGTA